MNTASHMIPMMDFKIILNVAHLGSLAYIQASKHRKFPLNIC